MNSAFKNLDENDKVTTRTLLHEAIPLTGTIVSGTYAEENIKNYSHGMFQSIYDYPYLSSSANHIFDITMGFSTNSANYSATTVQQSKKKNIYNQMAQLLVGYDITGNILQFDEDGDFASGGSKLTDVYFFNFSRLLTKDEIKKETFKMIFGTAAAHATAHSETTTIFDMSASTEYRVNSPVGEYGILYASGNLDIANSKYSSTTETTPCGLIYYQAGVVVLTSSILQDSGSGGIIKESTVYLADASTTTPSSWKSTEISGTCDGLRHRLISIDFNNTTEVNSTIYFCRANHNEFNYSSNPTYLNNSKIVVKNESTDVPVSYITTVGLYNHKQELLAVAKLSECLRKDPNTEFTLRVRVDY
tara:strand:- start:190 stop:1272 length:1083 start_codon:yes stop_codon:yes gene_type:complete